MLPVWLGSIPAFKGKGRLTLLADKLFSDYDDHDSYEVVGTLNDGVPFNFDLRPWGQKFAYYYRQWEKDYVTALRKIYCGGIFLDVGSSLGLYVVCMGDVVRRMNGSIISVEPVPFNLERQKKNVALNGLDDLVSYVQCALGKERMFVRVKTDPLGADNNAFIADQGDLEIEVRALDDLVAENNWGRIGLVKIDVEGYEPMVIEGARITIERDRPVIFGEFCRERMDLNGFSMDDSWGLLVRELGYHCYWFHPRYRRFHRIESSGSLENLLFMPEETLADANLTE